MILVNGKEVAQAVRDNIKAEVDARIAEGKRPPHLVAILVGNDGASLTYVGHKEKACKELGFKSSLIQLDDTVTQDELIAKVQEINADKEIDGLIVQLPLPSHINEELVIRAIDPHKDVDGFHMENVGRMMLGFDTYIPATPAGILELIKYYNIETDGKHCVIVGRSNIVGRPMANLMLNKAYPGNCTVSVCHSRTANLAEITRQADILIVAIGAKEFITADMVKDGVVVIDVGIHRVADSSKKSGFSLVGDVKFDEVAPKCSYITPVPGGVGPMTIVSLMTNTLKALNYKEKKRAAKLAGNN